jgi:hypothetical protein
MPELDRLKEEVAYLKFWQGVAVVTLISLAGWPVGSGGDADSLPFALAISGVISLGAAVVVLGRHIRQRIEAIGRL